MPSPSDIKASLAAAATKSASGTHRAQAGAPPPGGPQGVFDLNGTPVTSVNFSDSFVPVYSSGTSLIERRDEIIFRPTLGLDDWDDLVPIWTAEYGAGGKRRKIKLAPGNYKAGTNGLMLPGLQLVCMPGVDIECTYTPRPTPFVPYVGPFVADVVPARAVTALTSAAVIGLKYVMCAAAPAVGEMCLIGVAGGYPAESFIVTDVTGSGPYRVDLSSRVNFAFPSGAGSSVSFVVPNSRIHLKGNGATIHGPAERFLSIATSYRCTIEEFDVDAAGATEFPNSIDTGSLESVFRKNTVRNSPSIACYMENATRCLIEDCAAIDCFQGFGEWGVGNKISRCSGVGTTTSNGDVSYGVVIGHFSDAGATVDCVVENCEFTNYRWGVLIYGTRNTTLENVNVDSCREALNTLACTSADLSKPVDLKVIGGSYRRSLGTNITNIGGASNTLLDGVTTSESGTDSGNGEVDNQVGASMVIRGGSFTAGAMYKVINNDGTMWIGGGAKVNGTGSAAYFYHINQDNAAAVLDVDGVEFATIANPTTGNVLHIYGGVCRTLNFKITGSGSIAYGAVIMSPAKWHRGPNCYFGPTVPVNQIYAGNTGQSNFGVATLNGATPVSLPYTLAVASQQVFAQRRANAGTPGNFTAVINAGVGGTLTGTALDTSTVEWRID